MGGRGHEHLPGTPDSTLEPAHHPVTQPPRSCIVGTVEAQPLFSSMLYLLRSPQRHTWASGGPLLPSGQISPWGRVGHPGPCRGPGHLPPSLWWSRPGDSLLWVI